jgi:hypothetical protein
VTDLELVRAFSYPLLVLGMLVLATRRHLVRKLQRAQAYDDLSAVALTGWFPWQRWWQSRLEAVGVLKVAHGGRYWLDRSAWQHYRAIRRRRALTIVVGMALGAAIMFVLRSQSGS